MSKTFEVINQITKSIERFETNEATIKFLEQTTKDRTNLENLDNLYILVLIDGGLDKELFFPQEFISQFSTK